MARVPSRLPACLTDLLSGIDALVLCGYGVPCGRLVRILDERVASVCGHADDVAVALEDRPHVLLSHQHRVQVPHEYSRPNRHRVRVVRHVTYLAHHCICAQHNSRPDTDVTEYSAHINTVYTPRSGEKVTGLHLVSV